MDRTDSFADALKQRRKVLDMTQTELARRAGCAVVTIQRLEQGTMRPSRQFAQRLADTLDLPTGEQEQFVRLARTSGTVLAREALAPSDVAVETQGRSPLPTPLTPLIGRAREVAAVCQLLEAPAVRLLTLTGPGGIGKTRLALQAGADLLPAFADGALFVDLAPVREPDLVLATIAQTLGLTDVDGRPLLARLRMALRDKQLLLLLDNFEHVVPAAPVVAGLLAAAPRLKVLITSRVVAGVYGEHDFPVPPLSLPDLHAEPLVDRLMQAETVRLFVERAQAAKPDFCLTGANAGAVRELCHRLDGLPLAIELAAARVRLVPPHVLLRFIDGAPGRLEVLTGGPRTLPARQQALRDTLAWSYNLLDSRERRLYRRLAVFVGGCTLEAVETVCDVDGDLAPGVLASLQSLLDNSLIRQREGVDGEPRFTMLETIREYALEHLVASGELEQLQRRHADYFVTLAESGAAASLAHWWDRLEEEHANFRAALAWNHTQAGDDNGLRMAVALGGFWAQRGYLNEGSRWLAQALTPREAGAEPVPYTRAQLALRAQALGRLGVFAQWQGDLDGAVPANEASLALFQQIEDPAGIVNALNTLAMAYQLRGEHERAGIVLNEALALSRELGDAHPIIAWCLFFLGTLAYAEDDVGRAGELWDESLTRFRAGTDTWDIAMVLAHRAMVSLDQRDYRRAGVELVESLTRLRELGERWQIVHTLEVFARLAAEQAQQSQDAHAGLLRAAQLFGAAEALRETLGTPVLAFQRHSSDRGLATLRTHIDAPRLAAAWAGGRAMTLEQATAYALEADGDYIDRSQMG